jgi:hypothetical protein
MRFDDRTFKITMSFGIASLTEAQSPIAKPF